MSRTSVALACKISSWKVFGLTKIDDKKMGMNGKVWGGEKTGLTKLTVVQTALWTVRDNNSTCASYFENRSHSTHDQQLTHTSNHCSTVREDQIYTIRSNNINLYYSGLWTHYRVIDHDWPTLNFNINTFHTTCYTFFNLKLTRRN